MKSNNGFTLVELLAVVVILIIVLAIAVPTVTGIIKSSTKGAFKSDAKMVLQAIEYKKLNEEGFNPQEITKENMMNIIGLNSDNYKQVNISVSDGKT
jgi:type IV pilus assembly protein PilA